MVTIGHLIVFLSVSLNYMVGGFSPSVKNSGSVERFDEVLQKPSVPIEITRRDFLSIATVLASFMLPETSIAAEDWGISPDRPVAVLGAGGRTGMEVVQALAKNGLYTVSMTRTGVDPFRVVKLPESMKAYITHYPEKVDVVSLESLQKALESSNVSAIIFCASASKQGGTAFDVDDRGVGNSATLAKKLGVRLVVISALAVDRPQSKSYQITNTLGGNFNGIMDAKLSGEKRVRAALAESKDYVILRPGPLLNGKSAGGANSIELNQGDTIGGGLSRDELASAAVGALQSGVKGATVEVYRKSTATKLQPDFDIPSGRERYADSYAALFAGLDPDDSANK